MSSDDAESSKTLIICVDRDNDVGLKTGIKTPILGKDACLHAASALALADPEEADANTIFAAVKQYDEFLTNERECEVIVVAGVFERSIEGDRKIRREVAETLKGYPATEAVIISDGVEGEEVVPIINTVVPVVSVRRVMIKHSKSVEESYVVLGKYIKMLFLDPRYAKYALGVPGIIFIALAIIGHFVPPDVLPLVLIGFIGTALVIRGFDIDRRIESIRDLTSAGYLRLLVTIASAFIVLAGLEGGVAPFFATCTIGASVPNCPNAAAAVVYTLQTHPLTFSAVLTQIPTMVGYFIQYSQVFVWIGLALYITGAIVFNILRPKARRITRNIVTLIVLGLLYFPVFYFSKTLQNNASTIDQFVAIAMFVIAVAFGVAAYMYYRIVIRRSRALTARIHVKS